MPATKSIISSLHSIGGKTELANLAYACMICNKRKGPNLASVDPDTSERTWLYNPRIQQWDDHFQLHPDGTITSITVTGRATAFLLALNDPERVQDRCDLIALGKLSPTGIAL